MKWYLTLDIHARINVKDAFELLTNVSFDKLAFMFSFSERIDILYNKLKMEGFDV